MDPGGGRSRGDFRDRARRSRGSWHRAEPRQFLGSGEMESRILASGAAEGSDEVHSQTHHAQPRQFLGIGQDEVVDPGVGRSRGIGRGRLADPSCAAEAV